MSNETESEQPTDDELRDCVAGYIECMCWCGLDIGSEESGAGNDWPDWVDKLSDEARGSITTDCKDFLASNLIDARECCEIIGDWSGSDGSTPAAMARVGHSFYLDGAGHGGFQDYGNDAVFGRLRESAKTWTPDDFYVGDDGLIYG